MYPFAFEKGKKKKRNKKKRLRKANVVILRWEAELLRAGE